ncbi:transposase [Streptococcus suis]|nr:transposase [Streptococcus suis]NQO81613.1 transposase [Streptococcus suis]
MLGRNRGQEEGRLEGQLKIARQMLAKHFADELIKELTGLSQEDLDGLKTGGLDATKADF